MTNFYIIPGRGEKEEDYKWLISEAEKKYNVIFLDLHLKNNSLLKLSKTEIESNSIVLGFSTGALIAYKLETLISKGIYCSMSDILGEDAEKSFKHLISFFGEETSKELRNMDYSKPKAKKVFLFCGDQEMSKRMDKIGGVKIIKNTGHEFTENYKKAVLDIL